MPLAAEPRLALPAELFFHPAERSHLHPASMHRQNIVVAVAAELQKFPVEREIPHADAAEVHDRVRIFRLDGLVTGLQQDNEVLDAVAPETGVADEMWFIPELVLLHTGVATHHGADEVLPVLHLLRNHRLVLLNADVDPGGVRPGGGPAGRPHQIERDVRFGVAVLPGKLHELIECLPVPDPLFLLQFRPVDVVHPDSPESHQSRKRQKVPVAAEVRRHAEHGRNLRHRPGGSGHAERMFRHRNLRITGERIFLCVTILLVDPEPVLFGNVAVHTAAAEKLRLEIPRRRRKPAPSLFVELPAVDLPGEDRFPGDVGHLHPDAVTLRNRPVPFEADRLPDAPPVGERGAANFQRFRTDRRQHGRRCQNPCQLSAKHTKSFRCPIP